MKKQLLAVLLSMAVALTFIPTFAFAADSDQANVPVKAAMQKVGDDDDDDDGDYYSYPEIITWDEDGNECYIYSENEDVEVTSVDGLSYDEYSNCLTLNDYEGYGIRINNMGGLEINVNGDNFLEAYDTAAIFINGNCEDGLDTVNITGNGRLGLIDIGWPYVYGMFVSDSNLNLECEEAAILCQAKGKKTEEYGIYAETVYEDDLCVSINCPMDIELKYANSSAHIASAVTVRDYNESAKIYVNNNLKVAKPGKTAKAYAPRKYVLKCKYSYYDTEMGKRYSGTAYWSEAVLGASGASGKFTKKDIWNKKAKDNKPNWNMGGLKYNSKVATKVSIVPNNSIADMSNITFDNSDQTFDGTPLTASVIIDGLNEGSDYIVEYSNNIGVGVAKATITGVSEYTGTKSYTFNIIPKNTVITSVTPGSKSFKVEWDPQLEPMANSTITGYVIKYSTSESMSGAKKVTVKGATKASTTIKKLKAHKNYFVQIMTYKKVGKKTYYSTPGDIEEVITN